MANELPRICLDSSCLIDYLKKQAGIAISDEREKEAWFCGQLRTAAIQGHLELFVSSFTGAELTHLKDDQGHTHLDDPVKQAIDGLLYSGRSGILVANITIFTVEVARDLVWHHGVILKPPDLIHVASAVELRAQEFITRDGRIGAEARARILKAAGLRINKPSETQLLPAHLRQMDAGLG